MLCFIVEGCGVWMVVNGECMMMYLGDFIIMLLWVWYDYGNLLVEDGGELVVWFDGFDILLFVYFDVGFVENFLEVV